MAENRRSDTKPIRSSRLLKPEPADGEQIPFRNMDSRQKDECRCQERVRVIVVGDFSVFDRARRRFRLRRRPSSGLGMPDRNRVWRLVPGKSLPLCRCEAQVPVQRMVRTRTGSRRGNTGFILMQGCRYVRIRPVAEEQGQQERNDEQSFHCDKVTKFFIPMTLHKRPAGRVCPDWSGAKKMWRTLVFLRQMG